MRRLPIINVLLLLFVFHGNFARGQVADMVSSDCGEAVDVKQSVFEFFAGLDGSKQPQDFGVNANFGGRASINAGLPIGETGCGFQIGTAYNTSDNAVQVFERLGGPSNREQSFTTIGLFRRAPNWIAALSYDFLFQDSYDRFRLGQWRGMFGVNASSVDEFGIRAAIGSGSDRGFFGAVPLRLTSISQGNLYWRHQWETGARTTFWAGLAEGHGEANLALGDLAPVSQRFSFGSDLHVPLNDRVALYGEANFITPADTGTVDAYLGLVIYLDPIAKTISRQRYAPVLPVANSTTMSVDLARN